MWRSAGIMCHVWEQCVPRPWAESEAGNPGGAEGHGGWRPAIHGKGRVYKMKLERQRGHGEALTHQSLSRLFLYL